MSRDPFERKETFRKPFDPSTMTLEELQQKILTVQYFVPDTLPNDVSLKRMKYYVSFSEFPDRYYLGLGFRTFWSKDDLERLAANEEVYKLKQPIRLEHPNDLFLDSQGNIISACGHDPVNDPKKQVVASRQSYEE